MFMLSGEAAAVPYSGLVIDMDTERVLYERRADELRHPASLTKMMTLYLVFEALSKGELYEDTAFRASRFAVLRPPSRLGLAAGDTITVEEGILALVTRSANDAATVIAEGMAGSEPIFAALMTQKAHQLGMSSTVFRNASGLPDPNQITTAWDMYRLARALQQDFPSFYPYFSTERFDFNGKIFHNHNHLLETYPGTDGIKTGFVNSSGFNLVASAWRDGKHLVGVVFGGPSVARRDAHMREILDDGFAQLDGALPNVVTAEFDRPDAPTLSSVHPPVERSLASPPSRSAHPHRVAAKSHAGAVHASSTKKAKDHGTRSAAVSAKKAPAQKTQSASKAKPGARGTKAATKLTRK